MKKIIKLTENDLINLVNKVLSEQVKKPMPKRPKPPVVGPTHNESYEEMDEEWGSADEADKYNCCKRDICRRGQTCSNCRCMDLSKSRQLNKPKMESEEMDEEWGSADEADKYNCCRKHHPCHGGMCVDCRCVPKIRV
jgi:hypothetical protein